MSRLQKCFPRDLVHAIRSEGSAAGSDSAIESEQKTKKNAGQLILILPGEKVPKPTLLREDGACDV